MGPAAVGPDDAGRVPPSTARFSGSIADSDAADIDAVHGGRPVGLCRWRLRLAATERGRLLTRYAAAILESADDLAAIETRDNGKPLAQARADMVLTARYFEYYGGAADKVHGEVIPFQRGYNVQMTREPHGG